MSRTMASVTRKYVPYPEKHKWPKGFGSKCPRDMPLDAAQLLLERAIHVEGVKEDKLWAAQGKWCFCAHPSTGDGPDAWHGFPVIGGEVDERVLNALEKAGHVSNREKKRLRGQRSLPETWE